MVLLRVVILDERWSSITAIRQNDGAEPRARRCHPPSRVVRILLLRIRLGNVGSNIERKSRIDRSHQPERGGCPIAVEITFGRPPERVLRRSRRSLSALPLHI